MVNLSSDQLLTHRLAHLNITCLCATLNCTTYVQRKYNCSTLNQYFVLPLNGSKQCLIHTFKAIHVPGTLDLGTTLIPGGGGFIATLLQWS